MKYGTASRLAAKALVDVDRDIEMIAEALQRHGPLQRDELKWLVGGRYWGPGRFRMALRVAVNEGAATVTGPEYERSIPKAEGP